MDKNKRPYQFSNHQDEKSSQSSSRKEKEVIEKLKNDLQKRIIDNPKVAQKAAKILTLWINKAKIKKAG
ncbi:MAG: hypothetical protein M9962_03090 [Oligoflexia bacterium]|nr:hypothetical protein [Oligoflexia bacterium]